MLVSSDLKAKNTKKHKVDCSFWWRRVRCACKWTGRVLGVRLDLDKRVSCPCIKWGGGGHSVTPLIYTRGYVHAHTCPCINAPMHAPAQPRTFHAGSAVSKGACQKQCTYVKRQNVWRSVVADTSDAQNCSMHQKWKLANRTFAEYRNVGMNSVNAMSVNLHCQKLTTMKLKSGGWAH